MWLRGVLDIAEIDDTTRGTVQYSKPRFFHELWLILKELSDVKREKIAILESEKYYVLHAKCLRGFNDKP